MSVAPTNLKRTVLFETHVSAKAKLVDFGGWDMPVNYGSQIEEHLATRSNCGLFDVSHMAAVDVIGSDAKAFLQKVVANDVNKLKNNGQALYGCLLNEAGHVIDDLIVYRKADDNLFLIPNAANCSEVEKVIRSTAPSGIEIKNEHQGYGVLAVQGPKANQVLAELGIKVDLEYMSFTQINHEKFGEVIICRTGYTGEFGYELLPKWEMSETIWNALVHAVAKFDGAVCGLGARDTLRTEMGYPLHGHELSLEITPIQASASWVVVLEKPTFKGKDVLLAEKAAGPKTAMRAIKINDRGIPRAGMKVLALDGSEIGVVTSGTFSPTLKIGIALALVKPEFKSGAEVQVEIRGRISSGTLVKLPFVESHVK